MNKTGRIVLAFSVVLFLGLIVVSQAQGPANEGKSLADIAREARAKTRINAPVISNDSQTGKSESQYKREIQALMEKGAFTDLDAAADSARASKDRIEGGGWKLFVFYDTVSSPIAGEHATSIDWTQQLFKLQNWISGRPRSITARVALADAYINLAWKTRGDGYARTVNAVGMQQFEKQIELAQQTLVDAAKLPDKCPHWYFDMLEIARDQSWNKEQIRALFDRAVAFEPEYYYYYRTYASNLLPKWNGEPGETEAFADESYRRIGGRQGAFVYFEIASVLYCSCSKWTVKPTLSWPTIQEGFAELEERYVASTLKLNRFAALAYLYRDQAVAKRTLTRVNSQWDPDVWPDIDSFNDVRTWAGLPSL